MYIWRTGPLALKLKANTVSETAKMMYLLLFLLLTTSGIFFYVWVPLSYRFLIGHLLSTLKRILPHSDGITLVKTYDIYFIIGFISIIFLGTFWCYYTNRKGDNKNFIERFICLSVPTMIQIIFYTALLGILLWGGIYYLFHDSWSNFFQRLSPNISKPTTKNPFGLVFGFITIIPKAMSISGQVKEHLIYITNILCYAYFLFSLTSILTTGWLFLWIRSKIKKISHTN